MKVKLISYLALTLGLVASSLAPAAAVKYKTNTVYKATVNNVTAVYIDAPVGARVAVDLGNLPRTYTRVAGACGEVKLSPPKGNTSFTDLKVDGTAIDYASLATQTLPACTNGTFVEARAANFKTAKGQVVIVGKTAGASVSIEVPAASTRTVGVNGCGTGILRPQKGTTLPATFKIDGTTYTLADLPDSGEVPVCRKLANGTYSTFVPASWSQ
ncbi:hypothetical protein G7B40_016945 [Aetokthonos hydrillicola Thurmond2011]|uniref:Alpha-amylase n=1 Tax=Aetokthonos hydrillicola Thurmond2011 TaxID=2712845 RepID=A0AAP5M9Z7_9CYAN|nr:hypothetical protein [Aetokthonos hydrillicola]MBO3462188.1 hypothetical protein [Aetokthonos hydrillicola CCALA 1050]MBW4588564.1 hypothetical protein [Aetokthonos hydrillicola CCALA 1050]MDR9896237.1 hypothetical protein [Aetokthonos hydrillicola Thurmond2011]